MANSCTGIIQSHVTWNPEGGMLFPTVPVKSGSISRMLRTTKESRRWGTRTTFEEDSCCTVRACKRNQSQTASLRKLDNSKTDSY